MLIFFTIRSHWLHYRLIYTVQSRCLSGRGDIHICLFSRKWLGTTALDWPVISYSTAGILSPEIRYNAATKGYEYSKVDVGVFISGDGGNKWIKVCYRIWIRESSVQWVVVQTHVSLFRSYLWFVWWCCHVLLRFPAVTMWITLHGGIVS